MTSPAAPQIAPPTPQLATPTLIHKVVETSAGKVEIWHYAVTRLKRNRAMEKAILAYKRDNPNDANGGFYPSVFEEELVRECLERWTIPGHAPKALGWDLLPADSDVGDKIAEALGVNAAMESFGGKGKEVEAAKDF